MKTSARCIFLFLIILAASASFTSFYSSATNQADAQTEPPPAMASDYLWIPEKMIRDEAYHGVIVLAEPAVNGQLILLRSSDKGTVEIPQSVLISPGTNHATFEIVPTTANDAVAITAVFDGYELVATSQIYSNSGQPAKLQIILPNEKTKTQSMTAFLYSLDENDVPVPVEYNTRVKLGSSDTLDVSRDVMIKAGDDHTRFVISVNGNGFVSASSKGFESSKASITKELENVDVVFDIGPRITHENSLAYFYVWLEVDGKPFHPPYVVDAFLTSSDEDIASFSPNNVAHKGNHVIAAQLIDGFAKGLVHTGNAGHTTLLANIPEFGTDDAEIVVGKAVYNADSDQVIQSVIPRYNVNNDGNILSKKTSRYENIQDRIPTDLLMSVFPNVTDKNAYAVVGTYMIEREEKVQITPSDDNDSANPQQVSILYDQYTITPVLLNDGAIVVSSSGNVSHESTYPLNADMNMPMSAIEFKIEASGDGTHTLYASGTDIDPAEITFDVTQQYREEYAFEIVPLPFTVGSNRDVAMIHVTDGTGSMVNANHVSEDRLLELFVTSSNLSEMSHSEDMNENVKLYDDSHIIQIQKITEPDSITVSSERMSPATIKVIPSGIAMSVEIMMPKYAHLGEMVPYVIHDVDSNGIPTRKVMTADFSTSDAIKRIIYNDDDGQYLMPIGVTEKATVTVLSENGIDSDALYVFENDMSFDVDLKESDTRVGQDILLDVISSISGIEFFIESQFPYEKVDDSSFLITPDSEGEHEITVIGKKDGYTTTAKTVSFAAKDIVTMNTAVSTNDDSRITVPYDLRIGDETQSFATPFTHDIRPATVLLEFPADYVTPLGTGYKFDGIVSSTSPPSANEESHTMPIIEMNLHSDWTVVANYQRQVSVQVSDAKGSGVYGYGDVVNVSAPDREKMWFFVVEKFERWEGLATADEHYGESAFSFNATHDVSLTAMYRDDHTNWMATVMAVAIAVAAVGTIKRTESIKWIVDENLGFVSSKLFSKHEQGKKKADKDSDNSSNQSSSEEEYDNDNGDDDDALKNSKESA